MSVTSDYVYDLFISYSADDREWVLGTLLPKLSAANLKVSVSDHDFDIGVPRLINIERAVTQSRYILLILTPEWVESEWAEFEGILAQTKGATSRRWPVLPLQLKPCTLPDRIASLTFADFTRPAEWAHELARLIRQIRVPMSNNLPLVETPAHIRRPPSPSAAADFVDSLLDPTGTEPLESPFYVERDGDVALTRELNKPFGTTITIRAPRQTGKSSLLIRGIAQLMKRGRQAIFIDLQSTEPQAMQELKVFLHDFAKKIAISLQLDLECVEQAWSSPLASTDKLTFFLEREILPRYGQDEKIALVIDEADHLLGTNFYNSFSDYFAPGIIIVPEAE
jgi:AAA-like domain/TIR domain